MTNKRQAIVTVELMFKRINIRRGYTLIELLVVLAMIVLLTLFALPSYNLFRVNQEMKQKAEEIKELIQQAYNMSQNPEAGVLNYVLIFDQASNKVVLARDMTVDAQADPIDWVLKPENFVKEIALGENRTLTCPNSVPPGSPQRTLANAGLCAVMSCGGEGIQKQENSCVFLLPDSTDAIYDLEGDEFISYSGQTGLHFSVNDFDTGKSFSWPNLDDRNRFEINGLKTIYNDL